MPQSKLNVDGNTNNLKLNAGKYTNVRNRVNIGVAFAIGLSAVENSAAGLGSDKRNCRMVANAIPMILSDRMRRYN